jgi:WD40 repeat protein
VKVALTNTKFLGHNMGVNAVAYSRDGKTLISGGGEGTALVWDVSFVR